MAEPTYIFKDGHVYTMVDGQIVASAKEADFQPAGQPIEGPVQMPEPPADVAEELGAEGQPCPTCGQPVALGEPVCPHCGSPVGEGQEEPWDRQPNMLTGERPGELGYPEVPGQAIAQTVETPGGLKGRVLARTPSMWGEEVTVRFENGNIARIPVDKRLTFANVEQKTAAGPVADFKDRLQASYTTDRASLLGRYKELQAIQTEASARVAHASDGEAMYLDQIVVEAANERLEIESALEAIQAAEPVAPFASPADMPEVEQASMGGSNADWLEGVHSEMVAEAQATDYEKLMDEGPEAFVASLTAPQLGDAGTTRIMASRHINAKLAGADESVRGGYEKVWLGRIENERKRALANFKEEVAEKTASEEVSAPDESLFM